MLLFTLAVKIMYVNYFQSMKSVINDIKVVAKCERGLQSYSVRTIWRLWTAGTWRCNFIGALRGFRVVLKQLNVESSIINKRGSGQLD